MNEGRALKHVVVREYVRTLVAGMEPGSPAPSERVLVHRFGVARMTVRQAMDALVSEGLLDRIPGKGTFVARPPRASSGIASFSEEMIATRAPRRVADPPGPPRAGRSRRGPGARHLRG